MVADSRNNRVIRFGAAVRQRQRCDNGATGDRTNSGGEQGGRTGWVLKNKIALGRGCDFLDVQSTVLCGYGVVVFSFCCFLTFLGVFTLISNLRCLLLLRCESYPQHLEVYLGRLLRSGPTERLAHLQDGRVPSFFFGFGRVHRCCMEVLMGCCLE